MNYGDLQFYDIIIFAGIAAFLIFRLRSVLGKRSGFEKQAAEKNNYGKNKNVQQPINISPPALEEKFIALEKAYKLIENFDHKNFLQGAKFAFETIINSYNKGDLLTLKNLLTPSVYNVFENEIKNKNNNPDFQIFSLSIEKIESVVVEKTKIIIKVLFISEQFKNDDESTIIKKEDTWSFEKEINSKNPNWYLCST
ncbi:MAG: hypothetical protein CFH19_00214 [Alphaproteobacteria bacterium MarineAlpha5_Bin9]|nr:MAG: hypothetical protein CFH19_00214 [Alphaproteobacteria bacterium MarineAlpha5_Bin9]|tara:strand:- start:4940 stop:5530 length:591 start_codon:yes stop_codon:yes gene_type:complete